MSSFEDLPLISEAVGAAWRAEQEERRELRRSLTAEQALPAVAVVADLGQGGAEPPEGWPELVTPEKTGAIVLSI